MVLLVCFFKHVLDHIIYGIYHGKAIIKNRKRSIVNIKRKIAKEIPNYFISIQIPIIIIDLIGIVICWISALLK